MKFRRRQRDKAEIKLSMTAMIDIVFQLLVFFIMTFKVVEMEGDFNIKMPLASEDAANVDDVTPDIIYVMLSSGPDGNIASIEVDSGFDVGNFDSPSMYFDLTEFIERSIAGDGDASSSQETELEFDIDFELKYSYTVRAIEAVSGKVQSDGSVKKLIEKIKFKDNTGL